MVKKIIDAIKRHNERATLRDMLDYTQGGAHEDVMAIAQSRGL